MPACGGGNAVRFRGYHLRTRASLALKVVDSDAVDLQMLSREIESMQALQQEHSGPSSAADHVCCHGRLAYTFMEILIYTL